MGNNLRWAAPPSGSSWTSSYIYRSATQTGTFTQITTVALPTTEYYDETGDSTSWYKVSFYDSGSAVESGKTDAFQAAALTTYYTTPAKVAALVQARNSQGFTGFDGTTHPSIDEVIELIQQAEDRIDYITGHAWRTRYSSSATGSDSSSGAYEFYSMSMLHRASTGIPVKLQHRFVRTLASGSGDVLEVWNGSSYIDFLANKTEGRNNDYWLDNEAGVLWFRDLTGFFLDKSVRIKYRYGETTVPGDIAKCAAMMVAYDLALSDDRSYIFPEGADRVVLSEKARNWERQYSEILNQRTEVRLYTR